MKRNWLILLILLLGLSGCRIDTMLQADTIVDIPLKPTEITQEATEFTTEPPTESWTWPIRETEVYTVPAFENTQKQETPVTTEAPETTPPTAPPVDVGAIYAISDYIPGSWEGDILAAINACRAAEGLPALKLDRTLCGIASVRAYETSLLWSHARPDGRDGISVLDDYGFTASAAAEVLYYTCDTDSGAYIVDIWMNSATSRAQVLNAAYTTAGIGIYYAPDGQIYLATIFVT